MTLGDEPSSSDDATIVLRRVVCAGDIRFSVLFGSRHVPHMLLSIQETSLATLSISSVATVQLTIQNSSFTRYNYSHPPASTHLDHPVPKPLSALGVTAAMRLDGINYPPGALVTLVNVTMDSVSKEDSPPIFVTNSQWNLTVWYLERVVIADDSSAPAAAA